MKLSVDEKISQRSASINRKKISSQTKKYELGNNINSAQLNETLYNAPTISVIEEESISINPNSNDKFCDLTKNFSSRNHRKASLNEKINNLN